MAFSAQERRELLAAETRTKALANEAKRALARMPRNGKGTWLEAAFREWVRASNELVKHANDAAEFARREAEIERLASQLWGAHTSGPINSRAVFICSHQIVLRTCNDWHDLS
jgi:hypothetical protein